MTITNGSTAIFVKDIKISKEFYNDILKIPVKLDFGKNIIFEGGLALWEIDSSHIIPEKLGIDRISDTSSNRFELYYETEDIEEVLKTLKNNNIWFLHEIHEESWGQRTIRFFDPDNHLIEIGESLKQFISRFYKQGLAVGQISQQTHVPVEEIEKLLQLKN